MSAGVGFGLPPTSHVKRVRISGTQRSVINRPFVTTDKHRRLLVLGRQIDDEAVESSCIDQKAAIA
ncbi:MAG: hypothetical protein ABIP64_16195 [Burkholderiales bacterium]